MKERCALCDELKTPAQGARRPCVSCRALVLVCWLCGDGKDTGAFVGHDCEASE